METLFAFSPLVIAAIPVALGLVEVVKLTKKIPTRYTPVVSIVVGIGLIALLPELTWQATMAQGIIVGLAASGLWSGSKAAVLNK